MKMFLASTLQDTKKDEILLANKEAFTKPNRGAWWGGVTEACRAAAEKVVHRIEPLRQF